MVAAVEMKTDQFTDKREGASKMPPKFPYCQDAVACH